MATPSIPESAPNRAFIFSLNGPQYPKIVDCQVSLFPVRNKNDADCYEISLNAEQPQEKVQVRSSDTQLEAWIRMTVQHPEGKTQSLISTYRIEPQESDQLTRVFHVSLKNEEHLRFQFRLLAPLLSEVDLELARP